MWKYIIIVFILLAASTATVVADVYYVEQKGTAALDAADDGAVIWAAAVDIATPCSTGTAMVRAVAGDVVYFRQGRYVATHDYTSYHAHFEPANSGAPGLPITFQAYPGETPQLDCVVDGAYEGCTSAGNGDKDYIVYDGFRVTTDNGLLIGQMLITGFNIDRKVEGCVVRNCIFDGGSTPVTATDNRETLRIEVTSGTLVENNIFKNLTSTIDNHNTSLIKTYINDSLIIMNNEFYNAQSAIYLKRDTENSTVAYNYIHNVGIGIYVTANAGSHSGQLNIHNNLITYVDGSGESAPMSFIPADGETIDNVVVRNNTLFETSRGIGFGKTIAGSGFKIYNNIISGTHSKIVTNGDDAELSEADHNNYAGHLFNVIALYGTNETWYYDLGLWQASNVLAGGGSPGVGSIDSDPGFIAATGARDTIAEFSLDFDSPCLAAGRDGVNMGAEVTLVGVDATGDLTPPGYSEASVNGATISLSLTESVTGIPTTGDFTMDCGAGAINLAYVSGSGSSVYSLDAATPAANGDTCTISYNGAGEIADDASNILADFTTQAMTNNTPAEPEAVVIPNRGVDTGSGSGPGMRLDSGAGVYLGSY